MHPFFWSYWAALAVFFLVKVRDCIHLPIDLGVVKLCFKRILYKVRRTPFIYPFFKHIVFLGRIPGNAFDLCSYLFTVYIYILFMHSHTFFQDIHVIIFTYVHVLISCMLDISIIIIYIYTCYIYVTEKYHPSSYTNSSRAFPPVWPMMEPGLKPVISTEEMNMVVSGSWDRTLRHWAFFQHFFLPGWLGVSGGSRVGADFFLVLLCDVLWIYPPT